MIGLSVLRFVRAFFFLCAAIIIVWLLYEVVTGAVTAEFVKTALTLIVIMTLGVAITTVIKRIYVKMSDRLHTK